LGEAGFERENLKAGGAAAACFINLVETGKRLGYMCLSFKIFS